MTISEYQTITGITVPSSRTTLVTAQLSKARRILETLLGFPLQAANVNVNRYTETGKTQSECPCPSTTATYDAPDAVVTAYRLFPYNSKDKYLLIDPALSINKVKLINGSVTYRTFEADEYRPHKLNGIIKALEIIDCCWLDCTCGCNCHSTQLAVDAVWVWALDASIPADLLDVLADMVTYYSDTKKDIQAETLGSHSYRRADQTAPETMNTNIAIITKYAGPLGSIHRASITI